MDRNPALRTAAAVWALAIAVHFGAHLRRGLDASPRTVLALGTFALVFQVLAVLAAVRGHALGALLAVAVALPNAVGVVAVHLLPRWSGLSDAFPGAPAAANVTAFSWATAVAEVLAGLAFAYVGWRVLRQSRPARAAR